MVLVQWPYSCDPSLIPWWVGPSRSRKPWGLYWEPLLGQIAQEVNDSIDEAAWLAGTEVDSVLVAVTTPYFSNYGGKVVVLDGAATVELVVPDQIAQSRDLAEVAGYIESKTFEALDEVAKKLKIDRPARRVLGSRTEIQREGHADQISAIAADYIVGKGLLALVPPRMITRVFVGALARTSDELVEHRLHGWRAFRDRVSASAFADRRDPVVAMDFREIDVPARLSVLEYSKDNALVMIGHDIGQVSPWLDRIAPFMQGVSLSPILAGRDREFEWVVLGFAGLGSRSS
jgi:hypothetical protein